MQAILTILSFVIALSLSASEINAQTSDFLWKFGDNSFEEQLSECQTISVVVESRSDNSSAIGVPPYYLLSFEVGGVPTTTLLGEDPWNLSWQVNHKQGSALLLTVVDSNRSSGGVSPRTFNVSAGTDASCISTDASANPSSAIIASNLTDTVSTCQPWGLTIQGGQKPYTIVLSIANSPVITNVTMGSEDNTFTYIDRASPDEYILASVVDARGHWGQSTELLRTAGSNDTTCQGLASSSTFSGSADPALRTHNTGLVAGLLFGLGVPMLGSIAFAVYTRYRRPALENGQQPSHMYMPRPWIRWKRSSIMEHAGELHEVEADPLVSGKSARELHEDDVSSARSTYNTSPPPSLLPLAENTQARVPQGGKPRTGRTRPTPVRPHSIQSWSSTAFTPERPPVHPLLSPPYHSDDLPPSYENVIAQRRLTM